MSDLLVNPDHSSSKADQRPLFGIGHVSLPAENIAAMTDFYAGIGMRLVVNMGRMSILELRGGTHIIIHSGDAGSSTLDLIVDDIDETHKTFAAANAGPSSIERGSPHDRFTATDPEGNLLVINSNHAMGPV